MIPPPLISHVMEARSGMSQRLTGLGLEGAIMAIP